MPITVNKLDMLDGSSLTGGIWSNRYDRAIRTARVTGISNLANAPAQGLQDAILAAVLAAQTGGTNYHPVYLTLPLQRVRAVKYGVTSATVILEYFRGTATVPSQPGAVNRVRGGFTSMPWYSGTDQFDSNGLPVGAFNFPFGGDGSQRFLAPRPWTWIRPTLSILRPYLLTYDPTNIVTPKLGTINTSDVTFGTSIFKAFTIRFDRFALDWVELGVGTNQFRYSGHYQFAAVKGGWFMELISWFNAWISDYVQQYLDLEFGGNAFPVS